MKVPLSWLRELVQIDVPLPELRNRLTLAGLEVEDLYEVGSDWRGVTIGRIVELTAHPRRDALKVGRVDLGGRNVTVVTGATNLQVGDVVPHVAPGSKPFWRPVVLNWALSPIWPMKPSWRPVNSTSAISACAFCTWARRKVMTP